MNHSASDVVKTKLHALLTAVWNACVVANESTADPEVVRHLRVSSRRALVALSTFAPLLPKAVVSTFKQKLRDLRQAAGMTRDYDVLCDRLRQHIPLRSDLHIANDSFVERVLQLTVKQQDQNRESLDTMYSELVSWEWPLRVAALKDQVQTKNVGYLKFVRKHIRKPYKTFSKFSNSTKKNPKQLHSLRIAGKKLRYALELMPNEDTNCSLEKCRTSLKKIQKKLGDFTDHTAASEILSQLSKEPVTDDILNVIHNMQQEEQELANLSCTVFFGWWTRKRRHSISKSLEEALDNE